MRDHDINAIIGELEKHIQYLHHDYQVLLNRSYTFYDLKVLRMQIKQAEESLRLKKKMALIKKV